MDIHHPPWLLREAEAEAEIELSSLTSAAGLDLPNISPLAHTAGEQTVLGWFPQKVRV